jgi:predicted DNA-binding protein
MPVENYQDLYNRSKKFQLRLSHYEYQLLRKLSIQWGINKSQVIRHLINRASKSLEDR